MPLALRLFLAYFLFAGLSAYFIFAVTISEIKPGVRQSTEETLVDAANLLAEIIGPSLASGTLAQTGLEDAQIGRAHV